MDGSPGITLNRMASRETPTQKIADVTTRVAVVEKELATLAALLKRVDNIVEGDGVTAGINSRVQNLEYEVIRIRAELASHTEEYKLAKKEKKDDEKQEIDRRNRNMDSLTLSMIVLIVSNVIGLILSIFKK